MIETKEEYANLYDFVPKERLTREAFGNMLDLIESLRNVARAAQSYIATSDYTSHIGANEAVHLYEALDALPAWVLESEE